MRYLFGIFFIFPIFETTIVLSMEVENLPSLEAHKPPLKSEEIYTPLSSLKQVNTQTPGVLIINDVTELYGIPPVQDIAFVANQYPMAKALHIMIEAIEEQGECYWNLLYLIDSCPHLKHIQLNHQKNWDASWNMSYAEDFLNFHVRQREQLKSVTLDVTRLGKVAEELDMMLREIEEEENDQSVDPSKQGCEALAEERDPMNPESAHLVAQASMLAS